MEEPFPHVSPFLAPSNTKGQKVGISSLSHPCSTCRFPSPKKPPEEGKGKQEGTRWVRQNTIACTLSILPEHPLSTLFIGTELLQLHHSSQLLHNRDKAREFCRGLLYAKYQDYSGRKHKDKLTSQPLPEVKAVPPAWHQLSLPTLSSGHPTFPTLYTGSQSASVRSRT